MMWQVEGMLSYAKTQGRTKHMAQPIGNACLQSCMYNSVNSQDEPYTVALITSCDVHYAHEALLLSSCINR
jgi:hypothetical protein